MPTAIPVKLEDREFASQNQARLHYSAMLRRYKPGQAISAADQTDLQDLLRLHPQHAASRPIHRIQVVAGGFNRNHFVAHYAHKFTQPLSYVHCIRNCPRPAPAADAPVPPKKTKARTPDDALAPSAIPSSTSDQAVQS